jgi:hypothetical protein
LLGVDGTQPKSLSSPSRNTSRTTMIETDRVSSKQFVQQILLEEFGQGFQRRGRYPYMFENKNRLVYFQNFNAAYDNAWYRLGSIARQILATSSKESYVCFTIPVENEYYLIPYKDIEKRAKNIGWKRSDIEVNIDRLRSHWRELEWDLVDCKKRLKLA